MLPYDVLQFIADYADIDSRRYMGFLPRKISADVLSIMNDMLEKKHTAKYHGYNGQITTFVPTSLVKDGVMSAMYMSYHYDQDTLTVIHTTGIFNCSSQNNIGFDTMNIVRSVGYEIFDVFDEKPMCIPYKNGGLSCHVTPFNYNSICKHMNNETT